MTTTERPASCDTGDLYRVLGAAAAASPAEIKRAYRRCVWELRPDINPHPAVRDRFERVIEAYEVLSDPARRAIYDRTRTAPPPPDPAAPESPTPPPPPPARPARPSPPPSPTPTPDYVPVEEDPAAADLAEEDLAEEVPQPQRWADYVPHPDPPNPGPPHPDPSPFGARRTPPPRSASYPAPAAGLLWPRGWPTGRIEHLGWLCPVALALWRIAPLPAGGRKLLVVFGWLLGGMWATQQLLALAPAATHATADLSLTVLWLLPMLVWALRGLISGYLGAVRAGQATARFARATRQRWQRWRRPRSTGNGRGGAGRDATTARDTTRSDR